MRNKRQKKQQHPFPPDDPRHEGFNLRKKGTTDDIMSKIPLLDADTIEILKNCDLS